MSQELQTVSNQDKALIDQSVGVGIEEFEGVPASVIPLPRIKMVQGMSTDVVLADGKDASAGSFYVEDFQESRDNLRVSILAAQVRPVEFDDKNNPGQKISKNRLSIVFYDLDDKRVCISSFSAMSIRNWGKMMSQMVNRGVVTARECQVVINTSKIEDDKGKYWVANFQLGEELSDDERSIVDGYFEQYRAYLTRTEDEVEV